jgi:hypothetical protein
MRPSIWISILMVTWGIVSFEAYRVQEITVADTEVVRL